MPPTQLIEASRRFVARDGWYDSADDAGAHGIALRDRKGENHPSVRLPHAHPLPGKGRLWLSHPKRRMDSAWQTRPSDTANVLPRRELRPDSARRHRRRSVHDAQRTKATDFHWVSAIISLDDRPISSPRSPPSATNADEMCNFYLMYYVDHGEPLERKYCFTSGPPKYYWSNPETGLKNIPDYEASHLSTVLH